jgi:hypothetical protein
MSKFKVKVTNLGLVFGRALILSWNEIDNIEFREKE